jgi:CBS domain-containing protein
MVSKIGDVMSRHVITLKKGSVVMDAIRLMTEHSISCVIIVDNANRPAGIITERDMVKRVLKNVLDPRSTKIDDVMTSPVITMPSEKRVTDAINMMQKYHFRRIVIATEKNKLLGILTQSDLLMKIHKVQKELESMNENLRNTINSLKRYKRSAKTEARIKSLKDKIRKLENALERVQRDAGCSSGKKAK